MQDNQVLFEIKDLCKAFGDNLVLDHISTEIRKGEVVVIIGPSGSGKSILCGGAPAPGSGAVHCRAWKSLRHLQYCPISHEPAAAEPSVPGQSSWHPAVHRVPGNGHLQILQLRNF